MAVMTIDEIREVVTIRNDRGCASRDGTEMPLGWFAGGA